MEKQSKLESAVLLSHNIENVNELFCFSRDEGLNIWHYNHILLK